MRVVLDTNVALSAFLGESAPSRLIELASEGEIELADVLQREPIRRRFERKGRSTPEALALYEALAEPVLPASITPTAPDPDDDAVLACALAAGADPIVSGDKHLRNLKSFHRLPILSASDALAAITSLP